MSLLGLGLLVCAALTVTSAGTATAAVPQRCHGDGPYVWSHLSACGWPSASTTGPRAAACPRHQLVRTGASLRSTLHIRAAGTVISCRRIRGCLSIEAPRVVIRDVAVACSSGKTGEAANGTGVISIQDGASATISHVRTNGRRGVHACVWHQGTRATINALNCLHANDGVFSWADNGYARTTGDHVTIRNSYLHDFTTRTANGHVDGYQTEGSSHGRIAHNTFLMTSDAHNASNSAIAIWNSRRSSRDYVVRRNLIAGGGFAVYAHDYSPSAGHPAGGFQVTDIRFTNNVFSTRLFGCVGYYGVWFPRGRPSDGWHRTGNRVLETGQRIDHRNPTHHGAACV